MLLGEDADLTMVRYEKRKCLASDDSTDLGFRGKAGKRSRKARFQREDVVLKEGCCKSLDGLKDSVEPCGSAWLVNIAHGRIGSEKNSPDYGYSLLLDSNDGGDSGDKELDSNPVFDAPSVDEDYRGFLDVVLKEDHRKSLDGLKICVEPCGSDRLVNTAPERSGSEKSSYDNVDSQPLDGKNGGDSDDIELFSNGVFDFQSADVDYMRFIISLHKYSDGSLDSQSGDLDCESLINRMNEFQDGNAITSMKRDNLNVDGDAIATTILVPTGVEKNNNHIDCINESQDDIVVRSVNRDYVDINHDVIAKTITAGVGDNNIGNDYMDGSQDGSVIRSMKRDYMNVNVDDDVIATAPRSTDNVDDISIDNDWDPHYKMFLENLREDGKSYMLEINEGDGKSLCVKYEGENGDESMDEDRAVKYLNDSLKEKQKESVIENGITKNGKNVRPHNLGDALKTEKAGNVESSRSISRRRKTKTSKASGHAIGRAQRTLGLEKNVGRRAVDTRCGHSNRRSIKSTTLESDHLGKLNLSPEVSYNIMREMEGAGKEGYMVDSRAEYSKTTIARPNNETGEDTSSDSEVLVVDVDPYCNEDDTPFVTSKTCVLEEEIIGETGIPGSVNHSQFRKKLMDILKQPYNHCEYTDLLQKITYPRPKELEKRLRGGLEKAYKVDYATISYLDQHSDLAAKIDLVKDDRPKVLNLLRGFFYWLQNVIQEGSFRPWLDSSCLDVLP